MTERTLVIAILVALILLWFAETLNMKKTSKVLGGANDLAQVHFYCLLSIAKSFALTVLSLLKSRSAETVSSLFFVLTKLVSQSDFT